MPMSISAGFSPFDVITFVKLHAQEYAEMAKSEMVNAQDRSHLVRDIADFAAALEDAKNRGDWHKARQLTWDFMSKHKETWAGGSMDMTEMYCNFKAWDEGNVIQVGTYTQTNYPNADSWQSAFHSDWVSTKQDDDGNWQKNAQSNMDEWIKRLNDWKDQVTGDDKIGIMTVQADADQANNLYSLGSNFISKEQQVTSLIISNIGKG
jgi:hypothetical protein